MSTRIKVLVLFLLVVGFVFSCHQDVQSKANFLFNQIATKQGVVATVGNIEITEKEFYDGIESDLYEAELKIFSLKENRLKAIVLEKLMDADPRKNGLSSDDYLAKFISKDRDVSEKEIEKFIQERSIPKEHVNDGLKDRIKKFLQMEDKKVDVEKWLAKETEKNPVKAFFGKPERPKFDVVIGENVPMVGGKNAKVTIVEFSDFQCPFCVKGHEVAAEIKKKYGDKVKIYFKNMPLSFHNHAQGAAEAAMCANLEGKFWKMHDWMFTHQNKLDVEGLKEGAKAMGLNSKKFDACLDSHEMKSVVQKDIADATKSGVKSTPTFYVNGVLVQGAQPIEVFSEIIDAELNK